MYPEKTINWILDMLGLEWKWYLLVSLHHQEEHKTLQTKYIENKEDKDMEPGTIALILMFVVGYGGSHLF